MADRRDGPEIYKNDVVAIGGLVSAVVGTDESERGEIIAQLKEKVERLNIDLGSLVAGGIHDLGSYRRGKRHSEAYAEAVSVTPDNWRQKIDLLLLQHEAWSVSDDDRRFLEKLAHASRTPDDMEATRVGKLLRERQSELFDDIGF